MSERDDERKYAEQTAMLKRHFDPVLTEPIPARMYLRQPAWIGMTRAAAVFVAGVAVGLAASQLRTPAAPAVVVAQPQALAVRAARAHAVYAAEVRHPVEVDASQQDHLVKWLSKRLGYELKAPALAGEGFDLLGGRLLPGPDGGPVAQFMYQDSSGKRLTLYVSRRNRAEALTAFRFAKEGPVSVFYWIDRDCGYALSGEIDKAALARIATAVYRQLES
jgi:anti-sigma factor RsiW